MGQNRKSSTRAYDFRCSPNNGHRQDISACPFRAKLGGGSASALLLLCPQNRTSAGSFDAAPLGVATCRDGECFKVSRFHAARASASASTLHQSKMYMRLAAARDVQSLLHRLVRNHPPNIGLRNSELLSNFRWCDACLEGSANCILFADGQSYGRQFRPLTFSLRR